MKLMRFLTSLTGASLALALTLALRLPAQTPVEDPPSDAPIEQVEAPTPPEAPDAPEAAEETDADAITDTESAAQALRELAAEPDAEADEDDAGVSVRITTERGERVGVGSDILHPAHESAETVVAIMADAIVDGLVKHETVVILGDLTLNGRSKGEAVNVLGHLTINGETDREVVAVLSSVQLGPDAHVRGDFVSVGGQIQMAPGARIDGSVQEIPFLGDTQVDFNWLKAWVKHCLILGRPLWFGEHLGWVWLLVGAALVFYIFIALIAPRPVKACARTMEEHPGFSLLTAVLTMLLTPLLMVVLAVTGIGPPVLALFMFFVGIFGKVVFLAWLGRRFSSDADRMAAPLAVLLGGLVTIVIYLIPFAGFIFKAFAGFMGTGIVVYTMIRAMQADRRPAPTGGSTPPPPAPPSPAPETPPTPPEVPMPAPVTPPPPPMAAPLGVTANETVAAASEAAEASTEGAASVPPPTPPPPPRSMPPPMPAPSGPTVTDFSSMPRAGFWPRIGAALIDIILLAIVLNVLETRWWHLTDYFLAWVGIYHVVMWGLKGTTVGGVVLGLKLVRIDDRPLDWSIAIVRGLASYISLVVLGLGFAWVAFDPERQSWHDKIAGTTLVRVPKGISLI